MSGLNQSLGVGHARSGLLHLSVAEASGYGDILWTGDIVIQSSFLL